MTTIATLLSGGECVGVGAREAGLTHIWGFEIEDDIAQVARDNGFNVTTADVMGLDPTAPEVPDVLHASPVCKRASGANQSAELNEDGTKEAPEDIEMGQKIASFIDVMTPKIVTIENVWGYRDFEAFKIICAALTRSGYSFDYWHLNAADYGVAQTRKRLILIAKLGKGQRIQKPTPTHHDPKDYNPNQLSMFQPTTIPWTSWYEAIEDLIPGLPEAKFAPWQLERLPKEGNGNLMSVINGQASDYILEAEPAQTIASNHGSNKYRAFLVSDQSAHAGQGVQVVDDSAPFFPVRAGENGGSYPKAWLVDRVNTSTVTNRPDNDPAFTVSVYNSKHQSPRAWLSRGRVVSMTPRALARFQSIPDSYILPESKSLACTVIGNGVPPLLYQKIIKQLI